MTTVRTIALCVVVAVGLAACSGDDEADPVSTVPTTTIAAPATTQPVPETTGPAPETTDPASTTTAPPEATQPPPPTLPPPVPEEGSVRDVISRREDLSNINAAIEAWLADSDGREGVLRNGRGLTMFMPNNDGFTEDDLAIALTDFDAFTIFLSEHLKVGALMSDQLGEGVSTAMGVTYPVTEGPSIGGRRIVEADIEATNGVIHIIDGPLAPIATRVPTADNG